MSVYPEKCAVCGADATQCSCDKRISAQGNSVVDSSECLVAKDKVDRLEKVIDFLEKLQEGNYNPIYEMVLSYLRDVRDGSVPDYVMNPQNK